MLKTDITPNKMLSTVIILIAFKVVYTLPVSNDDMTMAMKHLKSFGYMADEAAETRSSMEKSLQNYQIIMGMTPTGRLDKGTIDMMNRPRCGKFEMMNGRHIQGTPEKFEGNTFWYKLEAYPNHFNDIPLDKDLRDAFAIWTKYINLGIGIRRRRYNASIQFSYGSHGDDSPFDGPGKVVGHASYPSPTSHFTHFDAEEKWSTDDTPDTVNFYQTAVHEIGHMLGLNHSSVPTSVMFPTYMGFQERFRRELDKDDIKRIQAHYGPKKSPVANLFNYFYDFLFKGVDNSIYVFYHDLYIQYGADLKEVLRGCVQDKWRNLPLQIDAAFETPSRRMFFFKGKQYWRYSNFSLDEGFPKMIYQGFKGIKSVDMALPWGEKILFFKDRSILEYDPKIIVPVEKRISEVFPKLPNFINAGMRMDENIFYFFRVKSFYIYNLKTKSSTKHDPTFFPQSVQSRNSNSCCTRIMTPTTTSAPTIK